MKALNTLKFAWSAIVLFLINMVVYAQEKKLDVGVTVAKETHTQWYASPVAWVIGAAVFILLLVALLRGRKD